MIAVNLEVHRPDSAEEAVEAFVAAREMGRQPLYCAGGTEIVTMARSGLLRADVLIDLKSIPETRLQERRGDHLWFGATRTLSDIVAGRDFPLLSTAARRIADHSVRNSITLGGNVAGLLPWREALLPFLLLDGSAIISGPDGMREVVLEEIWERRLLLGKGEFIVAITVAADAVQAPCFHVRYERSGRVDYPLVGLCAARVQGEVRFAIGGAFGPPLRSRTAEAAFNDPQVGARRSEAAVAAIGTEPKQDIRGSARYRRALLIRALDDCWERLGEA